MQCVLRQIDVIRIDSVKLSWLNYSYLFRIFEKMSHGYELQVSSLEQMLDTKHEQPVIDAVVSPARLPAKLGMFKRALIGAVSAIVALGTIEMQPASAEPVTASAVAAPGTCHEAGVGVYCDDGRIELRVNNKSTGQDSICWSNGIKGVAIDSKDMREYSAQLANFFYGRPWIDGKHVSHPAKPDRFAGFWSVDRHEQFGDALFNLMQKAVRITGGNMAVKQTANLVLVVRNQWSISSHKAMLMIKSFRGVLKLRISAVIAELSRSD